MAEKNDALSLLLLKDVKSLKLFQRQKRERKLDEIEKLMGTKGLE